MIAGSLTGSLLAAKMDCLCGDRSEDLSVLPVPGNSHIATANPLYLIK